MADHTRPRRFARSLTGLARRAGLATALTTVSFTAQPALADSGGVSFWLPGIFGSLAAVPVTPGWAYSTIYIHLNELSLIHI